ncbi:STE/STE20 protein kinase [Allomyces macrogynus ATCC 38327]|uniref:non-specific serine/threonine protein kinase n=1 Tax=Allomyces macrogynus (strain ATCC 38327) TaxID=578462 RepID=A0A0L0TDM2_ALLM3|nr:STE/STE20 protein kinase [Allomyces macrogynus ATCC 38327]|eukprot:KNE72780.1 STE/STE20 protein kinase [Allomyces macrogynus ATCC 38327]
MSKILHRRFGGPPSPPPPPPVDGPAPDIAPGSPPASPAAVPAATVMPGTSQWTLVNADGTAAAASPLKPDVDARKSPTKDKDKDKSPRTIMFKWKRGGHGDGGSDARLGAPTATSPKGSHTDLGAKKLDEAKRKISMPFNFERRVHVDEQLQWTGGTEGRDPAELFKVEEKLGQGAFGSVYRAVLKETGFVLAVKEIALGSGQREAASQLAMIENEINVLRQCSHSNLVQYFGCCRRDHCLWILTDYCGGGSMSDVLILLAEHPDLASAAVAANMASHTMAGTDTHAAMTTRTIVPGRFPGDATLMLDSRSSSVCASGLTESEVTAVTAGALLGLVFLHGKGIIHRDLKSANILLSLAGDARIADFGVSEQLTTGAAARNTVVGTPFWMAPEVVLGTTYATPADIWSLAITVIELVDGVPPLHTEHPMRALFRIPHLPPPTTRHAAGSAIADFIAVAAVKDPAKRATAAQLVMHDLVAPYILDPARRRAVLAPKVRAWKEARAMAAAAPVEETRKVNVDVASLAKASDAQRERGEEVGVGEVSGTVAVREDGGATVVLHDEEGVVGGEGYGTVVVHGEDDATGTVVVHDDCVGTVVVHSDAVGTTLVHDAVKDDESKCALSTAAPPPLPPRPTARDLTDPASFLAPARELAARALALVPWRDIADRVASLPIAAQMHDAWRRHVAPLIASGGAGGVRWSIHAAYWAAIAGVHWYYQGRIASG